MEHARKKLSEVQLAKVQGQKFLESLEIAFGRYNDFGLMLIFILKELEKRKHAAEKRLKKMTDLEKKKKPLIEPDGLKDNVITEKSYEKNI